MDPSWVLHHLPMELKIPNEKLPVHYAWMSQEVSKWLGSVGYNPNIPHL